MAKPTQKTYRKSDEFLRCTVDVDGPVLEQLQELNKSRLFGSQRDVFIAGLKLFHTLYRTTLSGGKVSHYDSDGKLVGQLLPQTTPTVIPLAIRRIEVAQAHDDTVRALVKLSGSMRDSTLERISSTLATARWNLRDTRLEVEVLAELIVCASVARPFESELLPLVLDLLTQLATRFDSFGDLVSHAIHPEDRPSLDLRLPEQRFLASHYEAAVRRKYGAA